MVVCIRSAIRRKGELVNKDEFARRVERLADLIREDDHNGAQCLADRLAVLDQASVGDHARRMQVNYWHGRAFCNDHEWKRALLSFNLALRECSVTNDVTVRGSIYLERSAVMYVLRRYRGAYRDARRARDIFPAGTKERKSAESHLARAIYQIERRNRARGWLERLGIMLQGPRKWLPAA